MDSLRQRFLDTAVSLEIETGEAIKRPPFLRKLRVVRLSDNLISIHLDQYNTQLSLDVWDDLCLYLLDKYDRRHWEPVTGPLTEPAVRLFRRAIDSPASVQLVLAAFVISRQIMTSDRAYDVLENCDKLANVRLGNQRTGYLYFVPLNIVGEFPDVAVDELILNNRLCKSVVAAGEAGEMVRLMFYKPFATPSGYSQPVALETQHLWDVIRTQSALAPVIHSPCMTS